MNVEEISVEGAIVKRATIETKIKILEEQIITYEKNIQKSKEAIKKILVRPERTQKITCSPCQIIMIENWSDEQGIFIPSFKLKIDNLEIYMVSTMTAFGLGYKVFNND